MKKFTPKEGTMVLDIIPYFVGKGNPNAEEGLVHWERTFSTHRNIGSNQDSYICLNRSFNKPCPACEQRSKLKSKGADEDLIASLNTSQRQLLLVSNRKAPDDGIQFWDVSTFCFGELLDTRILAGDPEDGENWENFFFLKGGYTLKVVFKEESGKGFKFMKAVSIDFKKREVDLPESILKKAPCLDECIIVTPYAEFKKVLLEGGDTQDDDEDADADESDEDEEEEVQSSKKPSKPSKKADDDEDDEEEADDDESEDDSDEEEADEDDSDEDEEEEEEEKPATKTKSKTKPAADEDEDDVEFAKGKNKPAKAGKGKPVVDEDEEEDEDSEDDEEAEEEEEKPAKSAKSAKPDAKSKPAKDEDEDEDWNEFGEDEEVEEKPATKPKKKK